jgi:hypothetical protein
MFQLSNSNDSLEPVDMVSSNLAVPSVVNMSRSYSQLQVNTFLNEADVALVETENVPLNPTDIYSQNTNPDNKWIRRSETISWKEDYDIKKYPLNNDQTPIIINKKTEQKLYQSQEVFIRYLKPPTPPPPGEIIIREEPNLQTQPAPPLVIRQYANRPVTPAPLVVREQPPGAPALLQPKLIIIPGKIIPPPPRKVIVERLAKLPEKPQSVVIERWLPYRDQKRRVIFLRNKIPDPIIFKPKNLIVQWESPSVQVKKTFKHLGVIRANPQEYVKKYGDALFTSSDLPKFVKEIRPPPGFDLEAKNTDGYYKSVQGDLDAIIKSIYLGLCRVKEPIEQKSDKLDVYCNLNEAS